MSSQPSWISLTIRDDRERVARFEVDSISTTACDLGAAVEVILTDHQKPIN